MKNVYIYILLFLIQYLNDIFTNKICNSLKGDLFLLFHHLVSIYILFGGLLFNKYLHGLFIIIVLIHWLTNNNKCELTQITNRYCGYQENKPFYDIIYTLSIEKIIENFHWYLLLLLLFIDFYK